MVLIQIAGAVVLVLLVVAYFVRGRAKESLRDAGTPAKSRAAVRPTSPPSPYQPSRGFRIIGGDEPSAPPPVQLPRLDPNKEFVFHEVPAPSGESLSPPHLRHDERWALERSMRHVAHPRLRHRRRWAALLLVLALGAAAAAAVLMWRHTPSSAHHAGLALVAALHAL